MDDHHAVRVADERFELDGEALRGPRARLGRARPLPHLGPGWERGAPADWLQTLLGCSRRSRSYNVTDWAEHTVGGHFPAVAEPKLLAASLREAFRPYR